MLLIWNGSTFFQHLPIGDAEFGPEVRDRQHRADAQRRADPVRLAALRRPAARSRDARRAGAPGGRARDDRSDHRPATTARASPTRRRSCAPRPASRGDNLVVISFQVHRFKTVNDQHGYETGDRLLKTHCGRAGRRARRRRRSSPASAATSSPSRWRSPPTTMAAPTSSPRRSLRTVTRPFAVRRADHPGRRLRRHRLGAGGRRPDSRPAAPRRHRAWIMRAAAASRRPVWFDAGMERALIAQGEIEQGIRFGLEHGQFVPYLRAAGRPRDRRDRRLRGAGALDPSAVAGSSGPTSSFRSPRRSA